MRSSSSCSMPAHPPVIDPHCNSHLLPTSFNHTTSWIFNLSFPVSTFPPQHIYKARTYPKKKFLPGSHPVFLFSANLIKEKLFFFSPSLSFLCYPFLLPPLNSPASLPSCSFPLSFFSPLTLLYFLSLTPLSFIFFFPSSFIICHSFTNCKGDSTLNLLLKLLLRSPQLLNHQIKSIFFLSLFFYNHVLYLTLLFSLS